MLLKLTAVKLREEERQAILDQAVACIKDRCDPKAIYVFGSFARLEATDMSDLDVVAVLQDHQDVRAVKKAFYRERHGIKCGLDIFFVPEKEFEKRSKLGGICLIAKEDGHVIYQKDPS